jgi:NADH dehydrogenase FAD-containing subunit
MRFGNEARATFGLRWKVVIIGGGFGGLSAARHLKSDLVDVTLVDRRNYHLFQPLLYQVATGSLSPGEIAGPLRGVLSGQKNTRVFLGTVVDVDPQSKRVFLEDGAILQYDSLIVAAGSEACYFGHNEWQEWAPSLKSVETIESGGRTDSIAATTVIWAGGITASPLGKILATRTNAETDKGGKLKVKLDLSVPNYPDIYVIGDLASANDEHGRPLPGLAQVAMEGGTYAARAILRKVKGQPALPSFRYCDKGTLAVIGRAAAVADVFGVQISGFPAWVVWAFIHLLYPINFQSRALVFTQWAIQYLTSEDGST